MKKTLFFLALMCSALMLISCEQASRGGGGGGSESPGGGGGGGGTTAGTTPQEDKTKLWPAQEDNGSLWGYINEKGEMAIPANFQAAAQFSCGYARVSDQNGEPAFINKSGEIVSQNAPSEDMATYFYYDVCAFRQENLIAFMDKNFKALFTPKFEQLNAMTAAGLARCREQNVEYYGYCDKNGNMVIPAAFQYCEDFLDGMAVVAEYRDGEEQYALINTKGDFLLEYASKPLMNLGEGRIAFLASNNKIGIMDKNGNEIVSGTFDDLYMYSDGLCLVKRNDKWGFIDKNGNYAIDLIYEYASIFQDNVAWVNSDGDRWKVIDKSGNTVLTLADRQYPNSLFHNGLAQIYDSDENEYAYIDKKQNIIYSWTPSSGSKAPSALPEKAPKMKWLSKEKSLD